MSRLGVQVASKSAMQDQELTLCLSLSLSLLHVETRFLQANDVNGFCQRGRTMNGAKERGNKNADMLNTGECADRQLKLLSTGFGQPTRTLQVRRCTCNNAYCQLTDSSFIFPCVVRSMKYTPGPWGLQLSHHSGAHVQHNRTCSQLNRPREKSLLIRHSWTGIE